MKKKLLIVASLALVAMYNHAVAADSGAKWLDDYFAAKAEAKAKGLPILADFTGSDWCGWCKKLDAEVFSQPAFIQYSTNFVLFVADFPKNKKQSDKLKEQNSGLSELFSVSGFPTVLLLDANGKVLAQTGYQPGGAEAYVKHLKELLEKAPKGSAKHGG
jgi:thiol:disulfide interchange protein